jgi:hypothetical protein
VLSFGRRVSTVALAFAAVTVGMTAAPAAASIEDFVVSATFDQPSYVTGEEMRITFSVTNNGPATRQVAASFDDWSPDSIRTYSDDGLGLGHVVTIGAGETRTALVTGTVGNPGVTTARLSGWLTDFETFEGTPFEFTTLVAPAYGDVSGSVFDDRNGNRVFDHGEGAAGITITWNHMSHSETRRSATTGADGEFAMDDLPTGQYIVVGRGPGGVRVAEQLETVVESGVDGLVFRAAPPITDLAATLEFDADSYAPTEAPGVRVMLTNSGDRPLAGIIANCNRSAEGPGLWGTGPGWSALAGEGVDIPAHSTVVLDVTEPMPSSAYDRGYVRVYCDFGYEGIENITDPVGSDQALVPGRKLDITGRVTHDGAGVAGVHVAILADGSGAVLGEATTGPDGRYAIVQVQTGIHQAYLTPPLGWRVVGDNPSRFDLVPGWWTDFPFRVEPA